MTVITLTDVARARLGSISFFCAVYLLLAVAVMLLWNYLAQAFEKMPRINYRRALALMLVSGLFLYVVLTMISGARELLTPGAWQKKGVGYTLAHGTDQAAAKGLRRNALRKLQTELWAYAREHEGRLPQGVLDSSFPARHWELPGVAGYYAYLAGRKPGDGRQILAYEPAAMGGIRYVLLTDGSIEPWKEETLRKKLENDDE